MTLQEQLNEARTALHQLLTGQAMVSITRDGKRIDLSPANRSDLERYIGHLEAQSGQGGARRRGPARVIA